MKDRQRRLALLASMAALFTSISIALRFFEILGLMQFPRPTSLLSRVAASRHTCAIKPKSLFNLLKSQDKRSLLIILDAYPSGKLYKHLYKEESLLHNYLVSAAERVINSATHLNQTPYSLAYILGDYTYDNTPCLYPFSGLPIKINFLLANPNYSSFESTCYSFFASSAFSKTKLAAILGIGSFPKINTRTTECSLASKATTVAVADKAVRQDSLRKSRIETANLPALDIIHDTFYHDRDIHGIDPPIIDKLYLDSLGALLANQRFNRKYSLIIVMSDHGPRHSANKSSKYFLTDKPSAVTAGSEEDDMEYGYFLYCIRGCLPLTDARLNSFFGRISTKPQHRFTINQVHRVVPVETR